MLTAFVDESARQRASETSACALAAVIIGDSGPDAVSNAMESLRFGKNVRVHWRIERPERRSLIVQRLAALPFSAIVTVCLHGTGVKVERARRYCLTKLLTELSARGINEVIIESRHESLDARDRAVLTSMRKAHNIRPAMRVTWGLPSSTPGLWAADCVAGAITWWLDGDDRYYTPIEHRVTVVDVDLP